VMKNGDLPDQGCGRLGPGRDEVGQVTGHGGRIRGLELRGRRRVRLGRG
jgi:hypothetical protein